VRGVYGAIRIKSIYLPLHLLLLAFNAIIPSESICLYNGGVSGLSDGLTIFDDDTTYEGDLIINENRSVVIENCTFDLKGHIIMSDSSTLMLRDAKIRLIETADVRGKENVFWFRIGGNASLKAINITIETISFKSFSIYVSDRAEASFYDVYSLDWHGLVCERSSRVQIIDSVCWSMIETRDGSILNITGSRIYGVNVTDASMVFLESVHTTSVSVAEEGSIYIENSTIRSDTAGLRLVFGKGTKLTLKRFPTKSSGVGYEYCESWNLFRDNEVLNAYINMTLLRVYLRSVQFVIKEKSDVKIYGLNNGHVDVVSLSDHLEVYDSTLNEVVISKECALRASNDEFAKFQAKEKTSSTIENSEIGHLFCVDDSVTIISSSNIESVEMREGSLLHLKNSNIPESTSISENAIIFQTAQSISITALNYDVMEGTVVGNIANKLGNKSQVDMIVNRDRVRHKRDLSISLNGHPQSYEIRERKSIKTISFTVPPSSWALSISMGPPPPKRVPFSHTLLGQQLISLMIIVILIIWVLLAWK